MEIESSAKQSQSHPAEDVRTDGPDFICIGMPRAGTGWLYDQLSTHPDFWMPPIKEIRYLAMSRPKFRTAARRLDDLKSGRIRRRRHGREWDERDQGFLQEAMEISGRPRDLRKYRSLFRHKGPLLSGDISPAYMVLSDEMVSAVAREFS